MTKLPIKIMALDIATTTGYVIWELHRNHASIRAYSIKAKGDTYEDKAYFIGPAIREVLREHRPHFVSFETPRRDVQQHKKVDKQLHLGVGEPPAGEMTINPASVILPSELTGAILGQLGICGLPWCAIPEGTWRKSFLGFGRQKGWARADYKKAARERCEMLSIDVSNNDMADAVGVAWATPSNEYFRKFEDEFASSYQNHEVAA